MTGSAPCSTTTWPTAAPAAPPATAPPGMLLGRAPRSPADFARRGFRDPHGLPPCPGAQSVSQVGAGRQGLYDERTTIPFGEQDLLDAAVMGAALLLDRLGPRVWLGLCLSAGQDRGGGSHDRADTRAGVGARRAARRAP